MSLFGTVWGEQDCKKWRESKYTVFLAPACDSVLVLGPMGGIPSSCQLAWIVTQHIFMREKGRSWHLQPDSVPPAEEAVMRIFADESERIQQCRQSLDLLAVPAQEVSLKGARVRRVRCRVDTSLHMTYICLYSRLLFTTSSSDAAYTTYTLDHICNVHI